MAYNSNNWETEATLRNQRKAKADSMSALLDHVDWNPETLEISLSGITLKWGDIEGADTVVQYTKIDGENVITQSLKATNLNITGGKIDINSSSATYDQIKLNYGNYQMKLGPAFMQFSYGSKYFQICPFNDSSGEVAYIGVVGSPELHIGGGMSADLVKADVFMENGQYLHEKFATKDSLSSYLKKSGNGLSDVGSGSFYVAVLDSGVFKYCTKSRMQEWLGIS